jgi:YeeE/YedE family (DUF395).
LIAGGILLYTINTEFFENSSGRGLLAVNFAGLLVGLGSRLGGGCTCGPGVCGFGRLSVRSLVATVTFVFAGLVPVVLVASFSPFAVLMALSAIASFFCGILFSVGFGFGGVTPPPRVFGFLGVLGGWVLSLAFVLFGAVLSYLVLPLWIRPQVPLPLFGGSFLASTSEGLDRSLIIGALLFGSGWGVGGYCPGPVITSLGCGSFVAMMFVFSMGVGLLLAARFISPILSFEMVKS